jgi:hypothetical protein
MFNRAYGARALRPASNLGSGGGVFTLTTALGFMKWFEYLPPNPIFVPLLARVWFVPFIIYSVSAGSSFGLAAIARNRGS